MTNPMDSVLCFMREQCIMRCSLTTNKHGRGGYGMTNEQRDLVRTFRRAGLGYGTIAGKTGLSVNTVKSFCRRNAQAVQEKETVSAQEHRCRYCGVPVLQNPSRKEKKFCSDRCRNQWWNTHRDEIDYRAVQTIICACCGKSFSAYGNAVRKYCSHACYIRHRFGGEGDE